MKEISEKLIEKISCAVGIIYDPYGLKKGHRDFSNIFFDKIEEQMAIIQEYKLLLYKNKNRKTIVKKSCEYLKDTAEPDKMDNSWILNFGDKSGTISDETLQEIWGRVLANQVNEPNFISKRLLHNLSLMSKQDAENFSNLTRFCFDDYKYNIAHPLIYIKEHSKAYANSGITTNILNELKLFF